MKILSQSLQSLVISSIAGVAIAVLPTYAQAQLRESTFAIGDNCEQLPKFGADSLRLRFNWDDNSAQQPQSFLQGIKGDRVIWERQFPWNQNEGYLNPAKTNNDCENGLIRLYSQMPFSAYTYIQTFRWQNQQLSYISSSAADPSAETVDRLIEQVVKGNDIFEEEAFGFFYPHRYIYAAKLADAIDQGHQVALQLYQQGNPQAAAQRLAKMFDLTVRLSEIVVKGSLKQPPQQWLESWQEMAVDPKNYVAALNDYGFFLQEVGDHPAAITIFRMAIRADRDRTVAYLNLADSLWAQGELTEARQNYRIYQQLMAKARWQSKIPQKVLDRLID